MKHVLVCAVLAALVLPASGLAGSQFGSTGATLTGPLDSVTHQPVSASYGGSVVFELGGVTLEEHPWVFVRCYQGRTLVYENAGLYYDNLEWQSRVFVLVDDGYYPSPVWDGGAASCTAELSVLWGKNHKVVAVVAFEVAG